jgi:hypothetical protein
MNKFLLRFSIALATILLVLYVFGFVFGIYLFITKVPNSTFAHVQDFETIGIWGFPIAIISIFIFILITFFILKILINVYKSNPFTKKVIPYLKYLKYSLVAYLAIQIGIYIFKNIIQSKIGFSIDHNLLFVLVALIFIDIYQQSINTYQEHQLTI